MRRWARPSTATSKTTPSTGSPDEGAGARCGLNEGRAASSLLLGTLPAFDRDLFAALQGEPVGWRVPGDGRARADRRLRADLDRRNQHRARADEGAVADLGGPLVRAVVVAADRPGTDVDLLADSRVA